MLENHLYTQDCLYLCLHIYMCMQGYTYIHKYIYTWNMCVHLPISSYRSSAPSRVCMVCNVSTCVNSLILHINNSFQKESTKTNQEIKTIMPYVYYITLNLILYIALNNLELHESDLIIT